MKVLQNLVALVLNGAAHTLRSFQIVRVHHPLSLAVENKQQMFAVSIIWQFNQNYFR